MDMIIGTKHLLSHVPCRRRPRRVNKETAECRGRLRWCSHIQIISEVCKAWSREEKETENEKEEGGRRKEEGELRKKGGERRREEEGGRRKEEGGRRQEQGAKRKEGGRRKDGLG